MQSHENKLFQMSTDALKISLVKLTLQLEISLMLITSTLCLMTLSFSDITCLLWRLLMSETSILSLDIDIHIKNRYYLAESMEFLNVVSILIHFKILMLKLASILDCWDHRCKDCMCSYCDLSWHPMSEPCLPCKQDLSCTNLTKVNHHRFLCISAF